MKFRLVLLLSIVALGLSRVLAQPSSPAADLLGTWEVSPIFEGADSIKNEGLKLTFESDFFVITKPGQTPIRGTYTIYPNSNPMRINVKYFNGPDAGKLLHGIFTVGPDGLTICFALDPKDEAPTRYSTAPGKTLTTIYTKLGRGRKVHLVNIVNSTFSTSPGGDYDQATRSYTGTLVVPTNGLSWYKFLDQCREKLTTSIADRGWKIGTHGQSRDFDLGSFQFVADKPGGGILWLFVFVSRLPDSNKAGLGYVQLDR